jgi:peroxiredoxin
MYPKEMVRRLGGPTDQGTAAFPALFQYNPYRVCNRPVFDSVEPGNIRTIMRGMSGPLKVFFGLLVTVAVGAIIWSTFFTAEDAVYGQAADLALPIHAGQPAVPLSSLQGHVVLLDFWASWYTPCRRNMQQLEELYEKYNDKGLVVVGVSLDHADTRNQVPKFLRELGITYPTCFGDQIFDMRSKYKFKTQSQLYVIDKHGKVRDHINSVDPHLDLEEVIVKLLSEK